MSALLIITSISMWYSAKSAPPSASHGGADAHRSMTRQCRTVSQSVHIELR
jgi:hypothetical protein